jgi:hypothetical protein
MRIEDVRIEDMQWIHEQCAGNPGNVPDRKLAVGIVDPAQAAQSKRQGVGKRDGKSEKAECHECQLATPACARSDHRTRV